MVVKGKAKVGGILGIVGGVLLLISAFMSFAVHAGIITTVELLFSGYGGDWASVGFDPGLFMIRSILTLLIALICFVGGLLGLFKQKIGAILMLLGGIVGAVLVFIPFGTIDLSAYPVIPSSVPVSMIYSFIFVDPFLGIIGGILGLALKE